MDPMKDVIAGRLNHKRSVSKAKNGVPAGGAGSQILAKISSTDYDLQWIDAPTGSGYVGNFDGGAANTVYGGIDPIDGGMV